MARPVRGVSNRTPRDVTAPVSAPLHRGTKTGAGVGAISVIPAQRRRLTRQESHDLTSRMSIAVSLSSCFASSSLFSAGSSFVAISITAAHSAADRFAKR